MNKVFLVGRISSDPILKVTNNGNEVVNVNLAVNDSRNRDQSYFFPCVAWSTTATYINTYVKKGDMVGVDGRLTRRSYVNKEGKETYVTEIVIDSINSLAKSTKTLNSSETAVDKIYNKTIASEGEVGSDEIDDLTNLLIDKGGNN